MKKFWTLAVAAAALVLPASAGAAWQTQTYANGWATYSAWLPNPAMSYTARTFNFMTGSASSAHVLMIDYSSGADVGPYTYYTQSTSQTADSGRSSRMYCGRNWNTGPTWESITCQTNNNFG